MSDRLKPLILGAQASDDIEETAVDHHVTVAGTAVGLDFVAAVETAFLHIRRYPGTGSRRYAIELDLPDLRSWLLSRFPYLLFYREREEAVDLWRCLHARTDIPGRLRPPSDFT